MYDLPSEFPEEPGLPDLFHCFQPILLSQTCRSPLYSRENYLVASDFNIYYDREHTLWHKRPDWFVVLGVDRGTQQRELRWSYVIWQELVNPYLVVELLSPGTEAEDLGQTERERDRPPTKWQVYEQVLQIPYYVIYDRYENQLRVFHLQGNFYQPVALPDNRLWLEELGLGLGLWQGSYESIEGLWLCFYDASGNWIPTPDDRAEQERERAEQERERAEQERERAEQERERAEQERERAEQERDRADLLRQLLLENGIDPDSLPGNS